MVVLLVQTGYRRTDCFAISLVNTCLTLLVRLRWGVTLGLFHFNAFLLGVQLYQELVTYDTHPNFQLFFPKPVLGSRFCLEPYCTRNSETMHMFSLPKPMFPRGGQCSPKFLILFGFISILCCCTLNCQVLKLYSI